MKAINLKKIIEQSKMDLNALADHLFPLNKFPRPALDRVINGKGELNSSQIARLSILTGLSASELFSGETWRMQTKKGIHKFTNGDYHAELDLQTCVTKLFHRDSLISEEVIHSSSILLSDYLETLDSLILKHKKHE